MTTWQKSWRYGIAPSLDFAGLRALRDALAQDDPRLIQNATCFPSPLQCLQDEPIAGACAVGVALWLGGTVRTVAELERAFAQVCLATARRTGDPDAARYFLNWFDSNDRQSVRVALLAELYRTLADRDLPAVA